MKAKLKSLDECFKGCEIHESSKNYWKVVCYKDHKLQAPVKVKIQIGFRTFYKNYFGSDKVINIEPHKKFANIYQMFSDKGMHMMDIFKDWVDEIIEEEEPKVPILLTNLLEKWDELTDWAD
jgi:hypothetical protein